MNPTIYHLCQETVIGPLMWLASMCSIPALFENVPLSTEQPRQSVTKAFNAPLDKNYPLEITFTFASANARIDDQIVGDRYSEYCDGSISFNDIPEAKRVGLGRPIPFAVLVRKKSDQSVVIDKTFYSLCTTSHDGANSKSRTIASLALKRGDYVIEVTNLQAQPGLTGVKTSLSLRGGRGK